MHTTSLLRLCQSLAVLESLSVLRNAVLSISIVTGKSSKCRKRVVVVKSLSSASRTPATAEGGALANRFVYMS